MKVRLHLPSYTHTHTVVTVVAYPSRHVRYHSRIRARRFGANIWVMYVSYPSPPPYDLILANGLARIVDPGLDYPLYKGFVHLGAGLSCGLTGLAAGYAVGYVGDAVCLPRSSILLSLTDGPPYSASAPTSTNQEYS